MSPKRFLLIFALLALLITISGGCIAPSEEEISLKVLFAGSLIIPFDDLERAYETAHPNVDVLMEGHGSIQVVRHVTELHQPVDVAVTADYALIPLLMYESRVPETNEPYANWYVRFATNRLAIAYTPQSKYADEIDAENWYKVIARRDVKVGVPDPRFDACGYRALMAMQLAENFYDSATIFENLFMGRFKSPIQTLEKDGLWTVHVPEIVDTKPDASVVIRGASIQLIALLESGDLDYAFEYESVIAQHGLEMVRLPDAVNLSAAEYADDYAQVQVKMDFQRFASVNSEYRGAVINYGVTVPTNAPHYDEAAKFVAFMLGPEGREIMQNHDHPLLDPPETDNYDALPNAVKAGVRRDE